MVERDIRIKPDDFEALYKILVCVRKQRCLLKPWEAAFEEELYLKLARRLSRRNQKELTIKEMKKRGL